MLQFHRCGWLACLLAPACLFTQTSEDRYPIERDGKVGFIDRQGHEVIAPQFVTVADMAHFSEGVAPVMSPDGAGYIDVSGHFVIGPNQHWGQPQQFHDGIAEVLIWGDENSPNASAFIDRAGKILSSTAGSATGSFADGLMPLIDDRKVGFVDKNFHWVISPRYNYAHAFSEGLACVELGPKWGYIDKTGDEAVPVQYDGVWPFSDGLGRVRRDIPTGKTNMTMEGPRPAYQYQYGFVDANGVEVIRLQYGEAGDFHQSRAFVTLPGSRLLAIVDKQGNVVHKPEFEEAGDFNEDLAPVRTGDKWGYVDLSGAWAIAPQFTHAETFWHGLARVSWKDEYGYIDRDGKTVWKTAVSTIRLSLPTGAPQ